LLSPGLGVITEAIFGSRKIFQRMQNYSLYSITTTLRMVLTFTILTVAFDFSFPTLLVAIIAILNDGTILTISKDRVKANQTPDLWNVPLLFLKAFFLSLWLVLCTLLLYALVDRTSWLEDWLHMDKLSRPGQVSMIYLNVAITGQATVFVTRAQSWLWLTKFPTPLLLLAFCVAQLVSTLIAIFGFRDYPSDGETDIGGCGWSYALFVWVWSIVWWIFLDPFKMLINLVMGRVAFLKNLVVKKRESAKLTHYGGNAVYGNFAQTGFSLSSAWPGEMVDQLGPSDIKKISHMIKETDLHEIEVPWSKVEGNFVSKPKKPSQRSDWKELRNFAREFKKMEEKSKRMDDDDASSSSEEEEEEEIDLSEEETKKKKKKSKKRKEKKPEDKGKGEGEGEGESEGKGKGEGEGKGKGKGKDEGEGEGEGEHDGEGGDEHDGEGDDDEAPTATTDHESD